MTDLPSCGDRSCLFEARLSDDDHAAVEWLFGLLRHIMAGANPGAENARCALAAISDLARHAERLHRVIHYMVERSASEGIRFEFMSLDELLASMGKPADTDEAN